MAIFGKLYLKYSSGDSMSMSVGVWMDGIHNMKCNKQHFDDSISAEIKNPKTYLIWQILYYQFIFLLAMWGYKIITKKKCLMKQIEFGGNKSHNNMRINSYCLFPVCCYCIYISKMCNLCLRHFNIFNMLTKPSDSMTKFVNYNGLMEDEQVIIMLL